MISFATLFLGLVFGTVPVDLIAARGVAEVELFLDGRSVARVTAPWRTRIDLGAELAPHELVAVATDPQGRELGRARQWINRPRALAEAGFVLEPGAGGAGRVARLSWRCLTRENPLSVRVTFDGQALLFDDPARIPLPKHVPEQLHFLHAELDFGDRVTASADAAFGGGERRAETLTNLTAVPVLVDGSRTPKPEELANAFVADGKPLRVVAVEEGPAQAVFVVAGRTAEALLRIEGPQPRHDLLHLGPEQSYRIVWSRPFTQAQSAQEVTVFPMSPDVPPEGETFLFYGGHLSEPTAGAGPPRVAQAVASAGLSAAEQDRRRAVVLVIGPEARDEGTITPAQAKGFLSRLGVPLFVWSVTPVGEPLATQWGDAAPASSSDRFRVALKALSAQLARQRIVWVEGTWLPQAVTLRAGTRGLALAR